MRSKFTLRVIAMCLGFGASTWGQVWTSQGYFGVPASPQAATDERPGELHFKDIGWLDGFTRDRELVGIHEYQASDGPKVFVICFHLLPNETAKEKFGRILNDAAKVTEQTEVLSKDGEVLVRRAVVTLAAGADKDLLGDHITIVTKAAGVQKEPLGDHMIMLLPAKHKGFYFIRSASLDDALEFERQKIKWDGSK